jgi:hypothetical protein
LQFNGDVRAPAIILVIAAAIFAAEKPNSFVGTVSSVSADASEVQVQRDNPAGQVALKVGAETVVQRIAPGEKSLANAQPFPAQEIRSGDRVLVTTTPDSSDARRIVVMAATDISKRNEADKQDWVKRGVTGIVTAKDGETIKLRKRSLTGDSEMVVTVSDKTNFKRYAPDSVKFADAKESKLAEVQIGDQLRARGDKSEDGTKVTAQDVVFGTFRTSAGKVKSLDVAANQITIEDLSTKKPTLIRITEDSKLKKMPAFPAMGGAGGGPALSGSPMMGGGPPGMGGGPPRMGSGGPPDLAQMLEMMPAVKLDELKPGDTVIVSSTKGAHEGEVTAIMVLANADVLIQMASARSNGKSNSSASGQGMQGGMQGAAGMGSMGASGLGGLELPSMIQ